MTLSPGSACLPDSTSTDLIQRVQAQDPEAWRHLVRLYGPLVDTWIQQARVQTADADDLFQEVFRAVAQAVGRFRKDRPTDSFRAWLRTITQSKLMDLRRRQRRDGQPVGGSDARQRFEQLADPVAGEVEADAAPQESAALRLRILDMIRGEFEERTWQAFWRVTVEGHAVKEVAADLGITASAVRLFKSRILRRLRDEMAGLES